MSDVQEARKDSSASPTWLVEFGRRLQDARERAGMSQEDVEARLGLPVRSLTRWENGRADPGIEKTASMAELYGTSIDWLTGRTSIEVCIQPGMILVDEAALATLSSLVEAGKRVSDVPPSLLRHPGINFATVVPAEPTVLSAEASSAIELRMRSLWERLGGKP